MRSSLFWKLLALQVAAAAALLLIVLGVLRVQTATSFAAYVEVRERQRLEDMAERIAEHYAASGDLRRAARGVRDFQRQPRPGSGSRGYRRAPLSLLDGQGQWLGGAPLPSDGAGMRVPIGDASQPLGYIARPPLPAWIAPDEAGFSQRQTFALISAAAGGLLLALLFAALISRLVQRPIQHLSAGTAALAQRVFETRIHMNRRDELGRLADDFNHLAAALAQYDQQQRQWLADAAHELRTPLAILRGELEALLDGIRPLTPDALTSMQQEVQRLERLTDDLHELSLAESGGLRLHMTPGDLREIITATTARFAERLSSAGFTLTVTLPEVPLMLHMDAARVEQIIGNLLSNLIRHATPGAVSVVARPLAEAVQLTVSDSGPGVPDAALPHLFDRLYRVDHDRARSSGGSGLGLAIVRSLVLAHGGRIHAQASSAGGLSIVIEWPNPQPNPLLDGEHRA